ncbi:hypothetical protein [Mesorhizobium sp. 10J20-29]
MKHVAILVPALLIANEAAAISRYQTTAMSCARVVAALDADGAAILRYPAPNNPSIQLYDRFVRDNRQCSSTQRARLFSVPTADNKACQVRKCVRVSGSGNR